MSTNLLGAVRACVFDAYGTLFDFASAARRCRDVLGDSFDGLTALWREKQPSSLTDMSISAWPSIRPAIRQRSHVRIV
jgi:hypothetical protein